MKPLYIFDLDGTLADISHRRHFVENRANRWDEFYAACVDDVPNQPVLNILRVLASAQCEIWIWSGRSDIVHEQTNAWLQREDVLPPGHYEPVWSHLTMRTHGNYTPDDVLKRRWYDRMSDVDKTRLVATFDDRDRVVKMWRDAGVSCFQVAPGDF